MAAPVSPQGENVELDVIKSDGMEKKDHIPGECEELPQKKFDTDDMFYFDLSWEGTKNRDYLLFGFAVVCLTLVSGSGSSFSYSLGVSDGPVIFILFLLAGLIGGKLMEDVNNGDNENNEPCDDKNDQCSTVNVV